MTCQTARLCRSLSWRWLAHDRFRSGFVESSSSWGLTVQYVTFTCVTCSLCLLWFVFNYSFSTFRSLQSQTRRPLSTRATSTVKTLASSTWRGKVEYKKSVCSRNKWKCFSSLSWVSSGSRIAFMFSYIFVRIPRPRNHGNGPIQPLHKQQLRGSSHLGSFLCPHPVWICLLPVQTQVSYIPNTNPPEKGEQAVEYRTGADCHL